MPTWRAFVPTTRAASPSLNDSDAASCVVATVEDRCDDSQRVGASISSTRNTCTESSTRSQAGLERFLPQSAPKRSKTSDGSGLEIFLSPSPQLLSRRSKASRSWKQGQNCGSWIRRGQRGGIGPQAQTIISNAYRTCDRLPLETRRALRAHMKPIGRSKGITFAGKMTSWLICLPTSTVENIVAHVQKTGPSKRPSLKRKAPAQATDDGDRPSGISEDGQLPHVSGQDRRCEVTVSVSGDRSTTSPSGFHNWLRLCGVASSHGLPKKIVSAIAYTVVEAKGDLGTNYHHRKFVTIFDRSVYDLCTVRTRQLLDRPLGGTGRPPDVELVGDGITCGSYFGRSGCSVLVVGGIISVPFPPYAAEVIFGAESQGMDNRAHAQIHRMGRAVRRISGLDIRRFMRTRVASDCGDGQMCRGGPKASHKSTASMNKLWTDAAGLDYDNASWDGFHQFNTAGSGAMNRSTMSQKFCNILKRRST